MIPSRFVTHRNTLKINTIIVTLKINISYYIFVLSKRRNFTSGTECENIFSRNPRDSRAQKSDRGRGYRGSNRSNSECKFRSFARGKRVQAVVLRDNMRQVCCTTWTRTRRSSITAVGMPLRATTPTHKSHGWSKAIVQLYTVRARDLWRSVCVWCVCVYTYIYIFYNMMETQWWQLNALLCTRTKAGDGYWIGVIGERSTIDRYLLEREERCSLHNIRDTFGNTKKIEI